MLANLSLYTTAEVRGTLKALRAQLSQLTLSLDHLEQDLLEKKPRRPPGITRPHDVGYTLFGQRFHTTDGTQIFVEVLRHFAELDPSFPARYSAVVCRLGRKRPYVARTREALYPGKSNLLAQTTEFAPGWFVGTNEGNAKKRELLQQACRVIGLRWSHDLRVQMP